MVWLLGFPQGAGIQDSKIASHFSSPTLNSKRDAHSDGVACVKGLISFLLRAKYYKSRDEKRISASEVESCLRIHHAGIQTEEVMNNIVLSHRALKRQFTVRARGSFF